MTNKSKMETYKFIVILLSYCVSSTSSYPAKPLNERSPELTWEAWLLVDDQNQNRQLANSDGMLRRRITPKSIFIAPSFSPESLPACAEGYSADMMGRCIKIIKLDQDAHYEFLIEKLKEKFSPADYDDYEDEYVPTAGPLQVNIPLEINSGIIGNEESIEETDIAIIVSPTKTYFNQKVLNLDKRDSKDDGNKEELYLKNLAKSTMNNTDSLKVEEHVSSSTTTEETTTVTEAQEPTTSDTTTDMDLEPSTIKMFDSEVRDNLNTEESVLTTTDASLTISTESMTELSTLPSIPFSFPHKTTASNLWRFPDEPKVKVPYRQVKFPNADDSFQSQVPSSIENISNLHGSNREENQPDSSRQSDDPVVFREEIGLDSRSEKHIPATTHRIFNRRNRDRHNILFPSRWSQSDFEKPVVLRFSRKSAYINTNQFKNKEYYRSIPMDDLDYLFKFKHKQPIQK